MNGLRLLLGIWLAVSLRAEEQVALAWDLNSELDLAGYRIHWGLVSGHYAWTTDVGSPTTASASLPVDDETYYFAVSAYNTAGLESDLSNEVSYRVEPSLTPIPHAKLTFSTDEDHEVIFEWPAEHQLPPDAVYLAVVPPLHGVIGGDWPDLTYRPAEDYSGSDQFRLIIFDGTSPVLKATVDLEIQPVNDAPLAVSDFYSTAVGIPVSIQLQGNDVDDEAIEYIIVGTPGRGRLLGDPPDFHYLPDPDYVGSDELTFKVSDGELESELATISIWIAPPDPLVPDLLFTTAEDTELIIDLALGAPDPVGSEYSLGDSPSFGELQGDPPILLYRPGTNFAGLDQFRVVVYGDGFLAETTVWILVTPVNDPPLASGFEILTEENTPVAVTLQGWDVEGDSIAYEIASLPYHGILVGTPPDLIYHPRADYHGSDQFTYWVSDSLLESVHAIVSITVNRLELPVEEWPVILDVNYSSSGLSLSWETVPGYTYRVVCKLDLSDPEWIPVSTDLLAEESILTFAYEAPLGGSGSFYAIRVVRK